MTLQEQQMLQGLVDRINHAQLPDKDPQAEQFIQQNLGQNPDAVYIMAQTILVQQYALDQARKQMSDLQARMAQQPPAEQKHTSFLGSLLGRHDEPQRQAPPPPPPPQQMAPPVAYTSAPMYAPSGGYPLPGEPQQGGGFLRSAMQTATGVAAGALAFEGIESLMHGFGHSAGYGPSFGTPGFDGLGGGRPEEVINNYYGDAGSKEHGDAGGSDRGFYDPSSDASRSSDSLNSAGAAGGASDRDALQDTAYSGAGGTDDSGVGLNNSEDYSGADDSMTSDDVGDDQGGGDDSGSFDSSNFDTSPDDQGGDFSGGDDGSGGY